MGASAHHPRAGHRGGDRVPAPRTTRATRLATAAGALALSTALGVAIALDAEGGAVVAGVAAAVLLLWLALSGGHSAPIPFVLVVLGAVYVTPPGDRAIPAPVYGAALLVIAELAYWSLDERVLQRVQAGVAGQRLLAILAIAAASLPAGALVLAAAEADVERSPALTAAGAAAVVASVGLLAVLARRMRSDGLHSAPSTSQGGSRASGLR